jgi:hypothetical protein
VRPPESGRSPLAIGAAAFEGEPPGAICSFAPRRARIASRLDHRAVRTLDLDQTDAAAILPDGKRWRLPSGWFDPRGSCAALCCEKHLAAVAGATHLFEEPGALAAVVDLAGRWFRSHLAKGAA